MQRTNTLLCFFLILALFMGGLPVFDPVDSDQDHRVDLQDVLLQVQSLARSAEKPVPLASNLKKTIDAMGIVTGLKPAITGYPESGFDQITPQLDTPCLIPKLFIASPIFARGIPWQSTGQYLSIDLPAPSPPPLNC